MRTAWRGRRPVPVGNAYGTSASTTARRAVRPCRGASKERAQIHAETVQNLGVPQPARRLEAVDRDARGPHLGHQQALSMAIIATKRWVPASVSEANMITPTFWLARKFRWWSARRPVLPCHDDYAAA
jgi:hypothetical protein